MRCGKSIDKRICTRSTTLDLLLSIIRCEIIVIVSMYKHGQLYASRSRQEVAITAATTILYSINVSINKQPMCITVLKETPLTQNKLKHPENESYTHTQA